MKISSIQPTKIKGMFSDEDYNHIYQIVRNELATNGYANFHVSQNGMKRYVFGKDSHLNKELSRKISETFDIEVVHSAGFFARYNLDENGIPSLPPHYDSAGDGYACITFTTQLDSNINWPIYVYDEKVELNKNEAIVFSGNCNIHWRPDIDFEKDSYVDVFVSHFFVKRTDENKLDHDHDEKMIRQRNAYFEKYKHEFGKVLNSNGHAPYTDFKPKLIENIFSEQEIDEIYKVRFDYAINQTMQDGKPYTFADPSCGYITSVYPLPEGVRKKLLAYVKQIAFFIPKEDGIHCPRYTLESGSIPQLKPHYDVGLKTAALTLSVQLKHTKPWKLYVNDDGFDLEFNQAVIFSGTHQIHWRPDIEFSEEDYYDILVCQYVPIENPLSLTEEHRAQMRKKADNYVGKYFS